MKKKIKNFANYRAVQSRHGICTFGGIQIFSSN